MTARRALGPEGLLPLGQDPGDHVVHLGVDAGLGQLEVVEGVHEAVPCTRAGRLLVPAPLAAHDLAKHHGPHGDDHQRAVRRLGRGRVVGLTHREAARPARGA